MKKTIKAILVDDHTIVRIGLRALLAATDHDILVEVVAEAASAAEFYEQMKDLDVDIALLDIRLPGESGIEIARRINAERPEICILMLSAEVNEDTIMELMTTTVGGFINKDCSPRTLFQAIEVVADGGIYYGRDIATLMNLIRASLSEKEKNASFTPIEEDVLRLSAEGLLAKEIGEQLGINPKTVSVHKSKIFRKLGINNSVELIRYALKQGLIKL